jgi:hypothetical protein
MAAICQGGTTIERTAIALVGKWITDLWQFAQKNKTANEKNEKQVGECWQFAVLFVRTWQIAAASA